jgi:hypothetical protein
MDLRVPMCIEDLWFMKELLSKKFVVVKGPFVVK